MDIEILDINPAKLDEYCDKIVEFAEISRREGLLAIEPLIEEESGFFKQIFQMIVDGTDPDLVKCVGLNLQNSISSQIDTYFSILTTGFIFVHKNHKDNELALALEAASPTNYMNEELTKSCHNLIKNINNSNHSEQTTLHPIFKTFSIFAKSLLKTKLKTEDLEFLLNQKRKTINSEIERCLHCILTGALSLQSGDNPRIVQLLLNSCKGKRGSEFTQTPPPPIQTSFSSSYEREISNEYTGRDVLGQQEIDFLLQGDFNLDENMINAGSEVLHNHSITISNLSFNTTFKGILMAMDDRATQKFLTTVNFADLTLAMVGLDKASRNTLYKNMSKRTCEDIQSDIELMDQLFASDVFSAQKKVILCILNLASKGNIILERPKLSIEDIKALVK